MSSVASIVADPAAAIDRLHAIADELVRRGDPWFAECLTRLESGAGLEAFGLVAGWRALARARRDRIIRAIAAERFPGISARTIADAIPRRPDLLTQISSRISARIVCRALAHAPPRNGPAVKRGSQHEHTGKRVANE